MWNKTTDPRKLHYTQVGSYKVAVNDISWGLEIYIRGYGQFDSEIGQGAPILIYTNVPKKEDPRETEHPLVYVWDNINDKEPGYRIDLAGAAEQRLA